MDIIKNNKCILYCRVSSKEQEDKGYSLEAQEKLLKEYAERKEFKISKIFKISESASGKQIRITFNEMLAFVKKSKINIILCEKIDRLTRNLKDGATVSDWIMDNEKREVHFVKENFVVSKNTKAHENLIWDMKVAIARFYTNNLSEEVKKGQKAKIEAGWLPSTPKLGYRYKTIDGFDHKEHIIDEEKAPFIKRMFELYLEGNYTLKQMTKMLYDEGLRGKNGRKVAVSSIHRKLGDPFYCGYIIWNGNEYEGNHEPIINEELFNEVQAKLKRRYKAGQRKTHDHLFKGMIRCADCGCLITWETQKKRHYGHCKGFKLCSQQGYVREEKMEKIINKMLNLIKPKSQAVLDWIKKALKEKHQDKKSFTKNTRDSLNKQINLLDNRLDKIYEDKLDGLITTEYYKKKLNEFTKQKKQLLKKMNDSEDNSEQYYHTGIEILDLAYNAKNLYYSPNATNEDKRILLQRIFSDLKLEGKTLKANFTPAYQFLSEYIPKLNATSELLKKGEYYNKTGSFEPAHPALRRGRDSNPRSLERTRLFESRTFDHSDTSPLRLILYSKKANKTIL